MMMGVCGALDNCLQFCLPSILEEDGEGNEDEDEEQAG